jgi:hypothetical protein
MRFDLSKARKGIGELRQQRYLLEEDLLKYLSRKQLIAGTPVEKYKRCNKGNCKCTRGRLHGPTYYISRKEGKKTKMIYIRQALWPKVKERVARYQRWRSARARMVKINRRIFLILDGMEKAITLDTKRIANKDKNDR